jgi:hypothetical protein
MQHRVFDAIPMPKYVKEITIHHLLILDACITKKPSR